MDYEEWLKEHPPKSEKIRLSDMKEGLKSLLFFIICVGIFIGGAYLILKILGYLFG